MSSDPADENRRTVEAYDSYAERYAEVTRASHFDSRDEALDLFLARVKPEGRILEVASGPGWDADLMESHGLTVRRTDISAGFIAVQAKRGKRVERLDLIEDDLGGPYDGLVALYVIQHIARPLVDGVIARMAAALVPDGLLLFSFQLGDGERVEAEPTGDYQIVMWRREEMEAVLARHRLEIVWDRTEDGREARWVTLVVRRA
ncbi:MAG TPA: methyltransferase domain-containing protein [Hyphomonadaceae bacterium]|nr:methyltransferase domain-containing protein [Hyphomonadaceae bacterium]